jgi:tetratricopeptide (TPR) repeat protein
MSFALARGRQVSLKDIAQGVAEELIAAGLAAAAQGGLRQMRASDWQAEVRAACQAAMKVATQEAALHLPPEAVEQSAANLAWDLERAGASDWLPDALAESILTGGGLDRVRDALRSRLGSRWDHLDAQGIELTRLLEAFPGAVVDELLGRARPGTPLFLILQIMLFRQEVTAATGRDVLGEPTTTVSASPPVPSLPAAAAPSIRASGRADHQGLDARIVETAALVLSRWDPPSLLDAREQLAGFLSELVGGVYWRNVDITPRTTAVEGLLDQLLAKDAGAAQLLPARAYLRGRQGRLYDALADYETYLPIAGDARAKVLADAGAMLMTLGHYPQARQVTRHARAAGLSPADALRTRQHELWIDDYQGRHLQVVRECRRLLRTAQQLGDAGNAYGAGHRAARALFAQAMSGPADRSLLELALMEHEQVSRLNQADNPYQYLWMSRIHYALNSASENGWWQLAQERMQDAGGLAMVHIWLDRGTRALQDDRPRAAAIHLQAAVDLWLSAPYPKGLFDASFGLGSAYAALARAPTDQRRAVLYLRMAEQLAKRLGLPQARQARRRRCTAAARLSGSPAVVLGSVDEQIARLLPERLLSDRPFSFG